MRVLPPPSACLSCASMVVVSVPRLLNMNNTCAEDSQWTTTILPFLLTRRPQAVLFRTPSQSTVSRIWLLGYGSKQYLPATSTEWRSMSRRAIDSCTFDCSAIWLICLHGLNSNSVKIQYKNCRNCKRSKMLTKTCTNCAFLYKNIESTYKKNIQIVILLKMLTKISRKFTKNYQKCTEKVQKYQIPLQKIVN